MGEEGTFRCPKPTLVCDGSKAWRERQLRKCVCPRCGGNLGRNGRGSLYCLNRGCSFVVAQFSLSRFK